MRNIAILSLATIVSILFLPLSYVFGQQQGFLFYENPDYNIKIQYPISNWTKNEDFCYSNSIFVSNTKCYNDYFCATKWQQYSRWDCDVHKIRWATKNSKRWYQSLTPYTTLSGLRAWQEIYYDYTSGKSMKGLVALTQKNGEEYQLIFMAQPGEFNRYLPDAQQMIKSFQITNNLK